MNFSISHPLRLSSASYEPFIYTNSTVYVDECLNFHCCVFATSSDTPLDLKIKASMISDMFSLVGKFKQGVNFSDTEL